MINERYRESALITYGDKCEICGHSRTEVHHIDYQEQWEMEKKVREAFRKKLPTLNTLLEEARKLGYIKFENNQLSKNDSTENLSVLCGNCHSLMHCMDVGKKILKAIKPRR